MIHYSALVPCTTMHYYAWATRRKRSSSLSLELAAADPGTASDAGGVLGASPLVATAVSNDW